MLVVGTFAAGLLWCVLRCLGWGLLLRGGWFLQVGCSWWCLVLLLLNDVVGWRVWVLGGFVVLLLWFTLQWLPGYGILWFCVLGWFGVLVLGVLGLGVFCVLGGFGVA